MENIDPGVVATFADAAGEAADAMEAAGVATVLLAPGARSGADEAEAPTEEDAPGQREDERSPSAHSEAAARAGA